MIERKIESIERKENSELDYSIIKKTKFEQIKEVQCLNEPTGIISI